MKNQPLPNVPSLGTIKERLPVIFPEGTPHRNYVVREMAAKTVFVMFYSGAVQGTGRWIRPDQVTKMTDAQAGETSDAERQRWIEDSLSPGRMKTVPGRWYAVNTREPIRDETLRLGLISTGAVIELEGLATTSSRPRYALAADFAGLFDENLGWEGFEEKAATWQKGHLSAGALARVSLLKRRAAVEEGIDVLVTFPNREARRMAPGPSSLLSKDVIEIFAPRFLQRPAVVFLTESRQKVVAQDNEVAAAIGLRIEPQRNLPDIILADLGQSQPLLVFVEIVITDGAVTKGRKEALLRITTQAGFNAARMAFVSAFEDRGSSAFRRLAADLAWGSFVWFASEPGCIVVLKDEEALETRRLGDLV